jgi:hypothetical protein
VANSLCILKDSQYYRANKIDEGIKGEDPRRYGRFAARMMWNPTDHNTKKTNSFIEVVHYHPGLNKDEINKRRVLRNKN